MEFPFPITAQTLNTLGLCANMSGVALLFYFGLPQPSHEEGVAFQAEDKTSLADGSTAAEHDATTRRRRRLYRVMAYLALSLMFAGFGCQLIALRMGT
jgi:hypothetical protein